MEKILKTKIEIEKLLNNSKFKGNKTKLINSLARHVKMKSEIESVTSYIDPCYHPTKKMPKVQMSMRVYCILNNILNVNDIPKCKCGKIKAFDTMDKGFRLSCGNRSCYQSLPVVNKKRQQKVIENFGSLKTGYDNSDAMKKKHGVENCSQLDWVKDKKIKTSRENWGADYPWQTDEGKRLQKKGVQSKWDVDNISQHVDIKKKKIETSQEHWGVDNPSQHPTIRSKILEKNGYLYELPSGNTVLIDSINEEYSIKLLLDQYLENQLIIQPNIPIKYQDKNMKNRVWFPDILTIPDNKLIEIKTYNMMRLESCIIWHQLQGGISSGYDVELFVVRYEKIYKFTPLENEYAWRFIGEKSDKHLFNKFKKYNFILI